MFGFTSLLDTSGAIGGGHNDSFAFEIGLQKFQWRVAEIESRDFLAEAFADQYIAILMASIGFLQGFYRNNSATFP
jgi:hypothetical protein